MSKSLLDEFLERAQNDFIDNTIKLSQMVEDGKLSSTGAKIVFSELYDNHQENLDRIRKNVAAHGYLLGDTYV